MVQTTRYPKEIQLFFNKIIEKVKEVLDPNYILIAGSFGKESWLYFNDELISDFEFVFVCDKRWSIKKKKHLQKELNEQYPYDINLKGYIAQKIDNKIISNYSFKYPGYISLDFFDTFNSPKFIYKKNEYISINNNFSTEEIPVWEAWRLYVNRMGDILKLKCFEQIDSKTRDYYWLKIFESTADVYLIMNKIYDKNISKRLTLFTNELIRNDNELDIICKESFSFIKQALIARNEHNLTVFEDAISIIDGKLIVNSWMDYFMKKLAQQEQLSIDSKKYFYRSYLSHKTLQKKYLGFNYSFNFLVSNSIRLVYNPKLLNRTFKFYNFNNSWRHLILLIISAAFHENTTGIDDYPETKKIASFLFKKDFLDKLNNKEFIELILKYWKILC